MVVGPVEYLVVEFPENRFSGAIAPEIKRLVDNGTIRVIDLVFISKDSEGGVTFVEIEELDDEHSAQYLDVGSSIESLVSEDDIALVAEGLEPNSSVGLLVWENVWAGRFAAAVHEAGGRVLDRSHVPYEVVLAAVEAAATS